MAMHKTLVTLITVEDKEHLAVIIVGIIIKATVNMVVQVKEVLTREVVWT